VFRERTSSCVRGAGRRNATQQSTENFDVFDRGAEGAVAVFELPRWVRMRCHVGAKSHWATARHGISLYAKRSIRLYLDVEQGSSVFACRLHFL
jgi:hypothetical protein